MLDLKEEVRAGLRAPKVPELALELRADPRLNITARLAWLMVARSHRNGFFSMGLDRVAPQLSAKSSSITQARRKVLVLGWFERANGWRLNRVLLPGEDRNAFRRRVQADHRLDLSTRVAWVLCDEIILGGGEIEISMAELGGRLAAHENNTRAAVRTVLDLGWFERIPGSRPGVDRNRYRAATHAIVGAPEVDVIVTEEARLYVLVSERLSPKQFFKEVRRWRTLK